MIRNRPSGKSEKKRIHDAAKHLAEWLNSPRAKGHPALELFQKAKELTAALAQVNRFGVRKFDDDEYKQYRKAIDAIALQFPGVGFVSGGDVMLDGFYFAFRSLGKSQRAQDGWHVMNDVRILSEAGALWKVRNCALELCGRAFAARHPRQRFHNRECKRKHERSLPAYKEGRRKKARKAYFKDLPVWARKKLLAKRARRRKNAKHLPAPQTELQAPRRRP